MAGGPEGDPAGLVGAAAEGGPVSRSQCSSGPGRLLGNRLQPGRTAVTTAWPGPARRPYCCCAGFSSDDRGFQSRQPGKAEQMADPVAAEVPRSSSHSVASVAQFGGSSLKSTISCMVSTKTSRMSWVTGVSLWGPNQRSKMAWDCGFRSRNPFMWRISARRMQINTGCHNTPTPEKESPACCRRTIQTLPAP